MAQLYKTDKTYFLNDCRYWIRQNRTDPAWTTAQINNTIETLWFGDESIRILYDQYSAGPNNHVLPGHVPNRFTIPDHPWLISDLKSTKKRKTLPTRRDADGVRVVEAPPHATPPVRSPAGVPGPTPGPDGLPEAVEAPPVIIDPAGSALGAPEAPPAPGPDTYHYPFWPALPWHADPDTTMIPTLPALKNPDKAIQDQYLNVKPLMWQEDETHWVGAYCFYPGTYGSAALYCLLDDDNNIRDRMVSKDCVLGPFLYSNPIQWRDRLPKEIALHRRIDRKRKRNPTDAGFENVVEHRGYRLMMFKRRYRIYLQYYAGRELFDHVADALFEWHRESITSHDMRKMSNTDLMTKPKLIEGLIWHIFRSLVKGLLILHHGTTSPTEDVTDWKPIKHLDLSLHNAFIQTGLHEEEDPRVVVSDLGMGFFDLDTPPTAEGEPEHPSDNPCEYVWNRVEGSHPPEHQFPIGDPPYKLDEKTDVWKVGALIWELMTHDRDGNTPMREDHIVNDGNGDPVFEKIGVTDDRERGRLTSKSMFPPEWYEYPMADGYSFELKGLVRNCLHWAAQDRLTLRKLDSEIEYFVQHNARVLDGAADGLRIKADRFENGAKFKRRRKKQR